MVLLPRGLDPTAFKPVTRTTELSVTTLGLPGEQEKHVGERYVIRARVHWSDWGDSDDKEKAPTVWLYGLSAGLNERGHSDDAAMVGTHALNSYQQEFLSRHCWSTLLGEPTSVCEGKVYLEIRRDPQSLFIGAELVGAEFEPADRATLLRYLEGVRKRAAATKR
jgi:hypothetical protein